MPGRPHNDEPEERGGSRRPPRDQIPFGALFLIATVAAVFVYGIVLKTTGAAPSGRTTSPASAPRAPLSGIATRADEADRSTGQATPSRTGADDPFGTAGDGHETPILPEPSSGEAEPPATPSDPIRAPQSVAPPGGPSAHVGAGSPLTSGSTPPDGDPLLGAAPPEPSTPGASSPRGSSAAPALAAAPVPPSREPSSAPRGAAPAAARRRARQLSAAKNYPSAAQAWGEWARTVPGSTWTVQVAAVRLDKAGSSPALDGLLGRDDTFVLPPGALPNGLSPVCVGTYDSEQAARRAATVMGRLPGSSGAPIVKPLSALGPR